MRGRRNERETIGELVGIVIPGVVTLRRGPAVFASSERPETICVAETASRTAALDPPET